MKFSISLAIVAIICIIALEQIDAFNSKFKVQVVLTQCKVWATDNSGNTVMDTGWMDCSNAHYHSRDIQANPYYLHAKVMASLRKTKYRGPFSQDTCLVFDGDDVDDWTFDQQDMSYCTKPQPDN